MFPGGSYCRGLTVAPDDPKTMYLASGAGGGGAPQGTQEAGALVCTRDMGESWERMDLGETPPSRMFQVAVDPAAPSSASTAAPGTAWFIAAATRAAPGPKSQIPVEMSRTNHVYPMVCG